MALWVAGDVDEFLDTRTSSDALDHSRIWREGEGERGREGDRETHAVLLEEDPRCQSPRQTNPPPPPPPTASGEHPLLSHTQTPPPPHLHHTQVATPTNDIIIPIERREARPLSWALTRASSTACLLSSTPTTLFAASACCQRHRVH